MAGTRPSPSSPKSGNTGNLFLLLLVLVLGAAVVLQFAGPYRGWAQRVLHRKGETPVVEPGVPPAKSAAVDLPPPPPASQLDFLADDGTSPLAIPEKSEYETRYEMLYNRFLEAARKPALGEKCSFHLLDGTLVSGILEELSPGKVVLRLKYGTMTYVIHQIDPRDLEMLFPARAAQRLAMAELRKETAPVPDSDTPEAKMSEPVATADTAPRVKPAETSVVKAKGLVYDPTVEKTPERLMKTLSTFAEWLKGQHRRVGGRIADKIHAKQQGKAVVLYLHMNPLFLEQDYDTQFRIAEGIAKFWAFRCEATGVLRDLSLAHVVMVAPDGSIMGGSTPQDATAIWVKR